MSVARYHAPRIAFFNHKGGVGKTTLTFNVASALGDMGYRVLLVDSDPQSNLTSIFIQDEVVDDLLDDSDTPQGKTIWSGLKPIVEASGNVKIISPFEMNRELYIVPGDIRLAEYEQELPTFWSDCYQSKIKGYRGISSLSFLVNEIAKKNNVDFIFYDSGPNIGLLNKIILLDCDFYIIPAACDVFSLRAIKALGHTLFNWITSWEVLFSLAPKNTYIFPGKPVFLGYVPQRFYTYAGSIVQNYARFLPKLHRQIRNEIINQLSKINENLVYTQSFSKIGEVKDFGQIATQSQDEGRALWDVENSNTRKRYIYSIFRTIAKKILFRIEKYRTMN